MGLFVTASVVVTGTVLIALFALQGGIEAGFLVLVAAAIPAVIVLAVIWLGVLIVRVVRKALSNGPR